MVIEPIDASELSQAQRIAERVILHNYAPFLGAEAALQFIESGQSNQEIIDGAEHCFVAKEGGRLVGFAIFIDDLLHLLMVDVPYQRKGYGAMLLAHVEEALFRTHATIRLQSFEENEPALRFYRKNGWRVSGKKSDEGIPLLLMEKDRACIENGSK